MGWGEPPAAAQGRHTNALQAWSWAALAKPRPNRTEARLRVTPHGSRHVRGREASSLPNPSGARVPSRQPVSSGAAARKRSLGVPRQTVSEKQRTHTLRGHYKGHDTSAEGKV